MNTHADKPQENRTRSIANGVSQKLSGGESIFQFVDNRPEAVEQLKLKEMANNSPQMMQLKAFQEMVVFPQDVIQRVGEVPPGYNQKLKTLMTDAYRIENRAPDMEQVRASPIMRSYVSLGVWAAFDAAVQTKRDLVEAWKDETAETLVGREAELTLAETQMDAAFTTVVNTWNLYSPMYIRNAQMGVVRVDGRVVEDGKLWNHIKGLPTLKDVSLPNLANFITTQINAWQNPSLRTWFQEIGFPPAGNGRLRISEIPSHGGVKAHMTLHIANVDNTVAITSGIDVIMDTLLPPSVDWIGTHVTLELFGPDDQRNPHYFSGEGFRIKYATRAQTLAELNRKNIEEGALSNALRDSLEAKRTSFRQKFIAFVALRRQDYV